MMNEYKKFLTNPIRKDRAPLQELLPLSKPLRLLIDPCDSCNFRCDFCFQSKERFNGSKMSMDIFNKIVDNLKLLDGPINIVHMYGLGEPLINENLPRFVEVLKENNLAKEVAITTNGSLLTNKLSEKLITSGLDRLSISLNGLCDDDFKRIVGVKVDFDKLYNEIKYFYSIRKQCHLHIKINGEGFNEEQRIRFVELFKDYSDSINIDHVTNVWPGLSFNGSDGKHMYDLDVNKTSDGVNKLRTVCPLMFYECVIHPDGSVSPCCVDYNYKRQNLGNIKEKLLLDIWQGEELNKLRCESLEGVKYSYSICNSCTYMECAATVNISPYREELLKKYKK